MNYCVDYSLNNNYINEIEELKIKYTEKNSKEKLLLFLDNFKDKRIIIETDTNLEIDKNYNISLLLTKDIETELPHFYPNIITTYEDLHKMIKLKPSDIYIGGSLGFDLKCVHEILKENNIKLRTFPIDSDQSLGLKSFFIRPEDISIYESFIDIFEIKNYNIYRIYKKDKKWFGNLNELGINSDIDSRFLLPTFGSRRVKCQRKCLRNNPCKVCEVTIDLMHTLKEKNLMIKGE